MKKRSMKVVLLERIAKLGSIGDIVYVRAGYARNFLFPKNMVALATPSNLAQFESRRELLEEDQEKKYQEALKLSATIDGEFFPIIRQASESGVLYGSVASRDIVLLIKEKKNLLLAKSKIELSVPIKIVGGYEIFLNLHPDVRTVISVFVARSDTEATLMMERSARGLSAVPSRNEREEYLSNHGRDDGNESTQEDSELDVDDSFNDEFFSEDEGLVEASESAEITNMDTLDKDISDEKGS
jgi:large subunit ribosomal protein L9